MSRDYKAGALRIGALLVLALAGGSPCWSATLDDCNTLRNHGKRAGGTKRAFSRSRPARDPYLRAEGFWALGNVSRRQQ